MDLPTLFKAAVLGLVEGITEFIPVSSTGHLIVAGELLDFTGERAKTFEIFIQLGAILAIVWLYRGMLVRVVRGLVRVEEDRRFALNLVVGFLPAAVIGLLAHSWIKANLFTEPTVAGALVVGGVAILLIERTKPLVRVPRAQDLRPPTAFWIGVAQVLSLFPGVSRSGATIMGGYLLGLSRTAATEFSFFLAIPVMAAATVFDLANSWNTLTPADLPVFAVGFAVSFLSAVVVVKAFLGFVARRDFTPFAWYRIAAGVALLLWWRAAGG
jgi:undecaprenyl-diphosphatase